MVRVITLEGGKILREASELTKSNSNVKSQGSGGALEFNKHLMAYENRREAIAAMMQNPQ